MKKIALLLSALMIATALCVCVCAEDNAVFSSHVDFSDLENKQTFIDYKGFGSDWEPVRALQNDGFDGQGDNGTLHFGPFTQLTSTHRLEGPYEFSVDLKAPNNQFFGVFVRSTDEPLNGTPYYEHDGSKNADGGDDNECIGATGVYVIPRGDKILLCVKTADASQPKGIGTDKTLFETGHDISAETTPLRFADDGEKIAVYVGGDLVCTVGLTGRSENDLMSQYPVFTRVRITDADGAEVKVVDNCRVSADFSTVAFGMRINSANIDNIDLKESAKTPEETTAALAVRRVDIKYQPEKTEYLIGEELDLSDTFLEVTYENGVKEDIRVTEDMVSGFDSSAVGARVITVRYGETSAAYSVFIVEEYGQSTREVTTALEIDTTPEEEQKTQSGGAKPVMIAAAAVAAVIFGVLIFAVIRGKKGGKQ